MEPITAISTALSGIKTATEITKYFKSIDGQFEEAEYKLKIIELMDTLIDSKSAILELKEIIQNKYEKIKKLEAAIESENDLFFDDEYGIYLTKDDTGKITGRYCQKCCDTGNGKRKIRLQQHKEGWICGVCGHFYKSGGFQSTKRLRVKGL